MRKISVWLVMFVMIFSVRSLGKDLFEQVREEAADAPRTVVSSPQPTDTDYSMKTIYLYYISADEAKETISNLLAPGEGVSTNASTNALVVRASSKNIERMEKVLKGIDKAPMQVHVQAKILEVTSGSGDNSTPSAFGFSWQYLSPTNLSNYVQFFGQQPPTADAVAPGMYAQLMKSNLKAYFEALEKKGNYDIVASPSIMTMNHQEAQIFIGEKIGYRLLLTSQTGTLQDIRFLETGTKLKFTPHITNDGHVRMIIYPEVSDGTVTDDGLPYERSTQTKSNVVVKSGETVVIGGLTKNYSTRTEIGVPIISSIPLLGNFFKRTELVQQKKDIIVLITPTVISAEFNKNLREKARKLEDKSEKKIDDTNLIH